MSGKGNKLIAELVADALRNPQQTWKPDKLEAAPRLDLAVFGEGPNVNIADLNVSRNAAEAADGTRTAMLLKDDSPAYGTIYQDVQIEDDERAHTFSVDVKAGTSPIAQIVMVLTGGKEVIYHTYLETERMSTNGEGMIRRKTLGNGWYRITITGPNNKSGNKKLRMHIYPRHGKAEDTGSLLIANPRLDP